MSEKTWDIFLHASTSILPFSFLDCDLTLIDVLLENEYLMEL